MSIALPHCSICTNDHEVKLIGGEIEYEAGHSTEWNVSTVTFYGGRPQVDRTRIIRGYGSGFQFAGCNHPRTNFIDGQDLPDPLSPGGGIGLGYLIAHAGTIGGYHVAPYAQNVRHAFTEDGNNIAVNLDGNPSTELLNIGLPVFPTISAL